ncbi:MAG: hypothetical protein WCJ14_06205 [Verrucomicrobiota bacterium]
MPTQLTSLGLALLCVFTVVRPCLAQAAAGDVLDTLILGDPASERRHALTQVASEVITGGLAEPARQLLAQKPVSYNGGSVSFFLNVDPANQNHVTVKLWGSDRGAGHGRLLLYLDGMQVGYRHEGDHDVLNQIDDDPLYAGRFVYQTVALPLAHTRGKTTVNLKLGVIGPMWPYGQFFKQKQKDLNAPSRGLYRVYTHTSTRFTPPAAENPGALPARNIRPAGPVDDLLARMKETVNSRLARILADTSAPAANAKGNGGNLQLLAEAYHTPWTVAYQNPATLAALVRAGDAFTGPGWIGSQWSGAGPLGEAIARVGPDPLLLKALDEEIEVPVELPFVPGTHRSDINKDATHTPPALSGTKMRLTRRDAWARFLRASVDWNRTLGRRSFTNQSMIVDFGIYTANRGLAVIAPERALTEEQSRRYLYESAGLLPWLGNDLPDGGSEKPFGTDYRVVSRKGVSRELGWVGTYGETILKFLRNMAELTGDPKLLAQLIDIQTKRLFFRYPSVDADGYRTMKLTSEIDGRTAHFPKANAAYAASDVSELWWMDIAAFAKDPASVGATQQCLEDNQYYPRLAQRAQDKETLGMMRNIDEYATVKALPKSSYRIPTGDGQPDFVFADEENAVIALKHGATRLFVNFYYRQERGVSGATRILEVEPRMMRIATVLAKFEVNATGQFWTRPDHIDFLRSGGFPPPDEVIHQAWAGEQLPIAKRPADAKLPVYGDWGPFVGKASFYHLRYGDYLFAVNTTENQTFTLPAPSGHAQARELVSGKTLNLNHEIRVAPLSTVVLLLEKPGR